MFTVTVDIEVWSRRKACRCSIESRSACRRVSWDSIATMSRMLVGLVRAGPRPGSGCARWARIRTAMSMIWVVTSSDVELDDFGAPSATCSSSPNASEKFFAGIRSTSRAIRTSPSSSVLVSRSVISPPYLSTRRLYVERRLLDVVAVQLHVALGDDRPLHGVGCSWGRGPATSSATPSASRALQPPPASSPRARPLRGVARSRQRRPNRRHRRGEQAESRRTAVSIATAMARVGLIVGATGRRRRGFRP